MEKKEPMLFRVFYYHKESYENLEYLNDIVKVYILSEDLIESKISKNSFIVIKKKDSSLHLNKIFKAEIITEKVFNFSIFDENFKKYKNKNELLNFRGKKIILINSMFLNNFKNVEIETLDDYVAKNKGNMSFNYKFKQENQNQTEGKLNLIKLLNMKVSITTNLDDIKHRETLENLCKSVFNSKNKYSNNEKLVSLHQKFFFNFKSNMNSVCIYNNCLNSETNMLLNSFKQKQFCLFDIVEITPEFGRIKSSNNEIKAEISNFEDLQEGQILNNSFLLTETTNINFVINKKDSQHNFRNKKINFKLENDYLLHFLKIKLLNQNIEIFNFNFESKQHLKELLSSSNSNFNSKLNLENPFSNNSWKILNSLFKIEKSDNKLIFLNKKFFGSFIITDEEVYIDKSCKILNDFLLGYSNLPKIQFISFDFKKCNITKEIYDFLNSIHSDFIINFLKDNSFIFVITFFNLEEIERIVQVSKDFGDESSEEIYNKLLSFLELNKSNENFKIFFHIKKLEENIDSESKFESNNDEKKSIKILLKRYCLSTIYLDAFSAIEKTNYFKFEYNKKSNPLAESDKIKEIESINMDKKFNSELKSLMTKNSVSLILIDTVINNMIKNKLQLNYEQVNKVFKQVQGVFPKENNLSVSQIPNVTWEDVGGLEDAKSVIYDTIQLPLKFPNLFKSKKFYTYIR